MINAPSLEQAITQSGSPVKMLWRRQPAWRPPMIPDEHSGWRIEQDAARAGVAISDLSHHMRDLFIQGPDATRLLADVSANNYESFAVGQGKQFVPVTEEGWLVQDGVLVREAPDRYVLSGPSASQNWVLYHGQKGGYDVEFVDDPDSQRRVSGHAPRLFRFQVQGPLALALVAKVFDGPLPETKFFHSASVELKGVPVRALRHVMGGQPGYEFVGEYRHGDRVKAAFLTAGEEFGLEQVGALAYATNNIETGWIPTPTFGIYTSPALKPYREWLSAFSFEGNYPLYGTWFSEDIEDYYVTPYEVGYGRSVSLDHDFIGRDALAVRRETVTRTKVTVVLDADTAGPAFGDQYFLEQGRYRIVADGATVGMTYHMAPIAPLNQVLALAIVDITVAVAGKRVELVYGDHPGPGAEPSAEAGFKYLRATIQPAPYGDFARSQYRTVVF